MLGFMKKIGVVVILLGVAYAGFRWGDLVFPYADHLLGRSSEPAEAGSPHEPSPELADSTLVRFERFRDGKTGDRMSFGGTELSSVLRYALPGIVPPGVTEPTVALEDGRVHASARVAVGAFPRLPHLDQVVGILPDTVWVEMQGSLVRVDQEHLAFLVDQIQVAHIPLPQRMTADVLDGLGADRQKNLPKDALMVPLPDGLESAFVQRDSLVLLARR